MTKKLIIYCDGGSRGNPGPAAIGSVIEDENDNKIFEISKIIGETTNNVAEYQAVISSLEWIKDNKSKFSVQKVEFYIDSNLVVNQLNGNYKIKNSNLKKLIIKIKDLESEIGATKTDAKKTLFSKEKGISINYNFIPREKNIVADSLVNQALNTSLS